MQKNLQKEPGRSQTLLKKLDNIKFGLSINLQKKITTVLLIKDNNGKYTEIKRLLVCT